MNIVVSENGYDYELTVVMNGRVSEYVSIEDGFIRIDGEQTLSKGGKIVPIFLFAEFTRKGAQTIN